MNSKNITFTLGILVTILCSFSCQDKTNPIDWEDLRIVEFRNEWNQELEDSIPSPVYNKQQKMLDGKIVRIKGAIINMGSTHLIFNPNFNNGAFHTPPADQCIHLKKSALKNSELTSLKRKELIIEGELD